MRKIHSRLEIIKHKNHGKDTYLVQGLVNGAKLYLNPYFLKIKIKVNISETKFLSFYKTLIGLLSIERN